MIPAELPVLPELRQFAVAGRERADAARNRAAILRAAERLVSAHGADAVTMDAVACAAGVGKGTLFRRFGDRPGLLRALLNDREGAFQEGFIRGPAPLGPGAPPAERLVAFGHHLLDLMEAQGDLLAAAESGSSGLRMRHSVYATYRAHVAGLLRLARPDADVDYLTDALLAPLAVEVVLFQRRELGLPLDRLKEGWRMLTTAALTDASGERPADQSAPRSASR
ncbi:MAG: TetR/AcrR family transcriptional regulator [Solirubrobacterales bacterium]|nr:TetR/AcrR family transcriptional regulator [Solirubrobacterales bacterium]